jgi:hypothetical protein
MPTQMLTYDELATTWGVSREAARKKVEGLRLSKQSGNDGKVRVLIDLGEVEHHPLKRRPERKPTGDHAEAEALRQHVETLRAEVDRLTTLAMSNRADFERERDRAEKAAADLVALIDRISQVEKAKAETIFEAEAARAEVEKARAELQAWKARSWWRRAFG